jgi:hypothetical protein
MPGSPARSGIRVIASRAVIGTQAHFGGVPVEEKVLALAPVAWALLAGGRVAAGRRAHPRHSTGDDRQRAHRDE